MTEKQGLMPADSRKGLKKSLPRQMPGNNNRLGEPGRHRRTVNRRGLHLNTGVGYHTQRDPFLREDMVSFSMRGLFSLYTARLLHLVAHPVGREPILHVGIRCLDRWTIVHYTEYYNNGRLSIIENTREV